MRGKRGPTHGWLNLDNLFDNWRLRIPAKNVLLSAEGASRNIWQTLSVFASSQILIWWISFLVILVDIWSGWTNLEANQALNILIPQMTTARGFCLIEAVIWSVLASDWSMKALIGSYWLILATVHSASPCANFLVISQAGIMQALLQHKYLAADCVGECRADQHEQRVSLIWSSLGTDLGLPQSSQTRVDIFPKNPHCF